MSILTKIGSPFAALGTRRRRVFALLAACALLPLATGAFALAVFPTSVPVARTVAWLFGAEYLGRAGVVMQQGDADCGIAALQMALQARGVPGSSLDGPRADALRDGDGTSLLYLKQLAEERGVRTVGLRMGLHQLARAPLPALVHLGDHFAVVDRVRANGHVEMRDPALGRLRISPADFLDIWTGDVLLFPPPRPRKPASAAAHAAPASAPSPGAPR